MIRHVAAAVLYAAVTLVGSLNLPPNSGLADDDDDDDSTVECVEYSAAPEHRKTSHVLSIASGLCNEQIDGAWIIHNSKGPAAAAAVHHDGRDVAVIDLVDCANLELHNLKSASAVPRAVAKEEPHLLERALAFCRETGVLKIKVQAPGLDTAAVRALVESLGYQHARTTVNGDTPQLEFYADLYWRESVGDRNKRSRDLSTT